jgi:CRP-like cAMP-binding protein
MSDFEVTSENQLLSALPSSVYQHLSPYLKSVNLTSGQIVHEAHKTITEIYFPTTAIFSSVIKLTGGATAEIALIGNEGLVGLSAILGDGLIVSNHLVQISGTALKIPTKIIRQEFQQERACQSLLLLYTQTYIAHISHLAACNSLHTIEQRLARFLLLVADCLAQETLPLTQKLIASILGVRRASITETAITFQAQKIIQYSRGKIIILNRSLLKAIACECYGKIKSDYQIFAQGKSWNK